MKNLNIGYEDYVDAGKRKPQLYNLQFKVEVSETGQEYYEKMRDDLILDIKKQVGKLSLLTESQGNQM